MYNSFVKRLVIKKMYAPATGIRLKRQKLFFFGPHKMKLMVLMAKDIVKEDLSTLTGTSKLSTKKERMMANLS